MAYNLNQIIASINAKAAAATIDTSVQELYKLVVSAVEAGGGSNIYDSAGNFPTPDSDYVGSVLWSDGDNSLFFLDSANGNWTLVQNPSPPNQVNFTTTGSQTYTIPPGVSTISIMAIGGGGAGDNGNAGDGGGGGGSGGACAYANNITVTSGDTLTIVVGAGGVVDTTFNARTDSGDTSSITYGSFVMTAPGGQGGANYATNPGSISYDPTFVNTPAGVTTGGYAGGGGGGGFDGGGGGGGAGGPGGVGGNGGGAISSKLYTSGFDGAGTGAGGGGAGYNLTGGIGSSGGGNGGAGQNNTTGGGGGGAYTYSSTVLTTDGQAGNGITTAGGIGGSKGGDGGFPGGGGGGSWDTGYGVGSPGGNGFVRIVLGPGRAFPNNAEDL